MLGDLSPLPGTIPTLNPKGAGALLGPRYILERPMDVSGTDAAGLFRSLWALHGDTPRRLSVPFALMRDQDPVMASDFSFHRVQMSAPHEARSGGFLLFPDMSVIICKRADDQPWGSRDGTEPHVTLLPIIFRIAPFIHGRSSPLGLTIRQGKAGAELALAGTTNAEALGVAREQLAREAAAWAAWISRMPVIAPPGAHVCGSCWPSFFSREIEQSPELVEFERHVTRAVRSVMAWAPGTFLQAQVSCWSSRPLQGGFEPLRIALTWQFSGNGQPYSADALSAHVHELVFSAPSPWTMNAFPACKIYAADIEGSPAYGAHRELFTQLVQAPISNHERLALRGNFAAPPAPSPLPGQPGYGQVPLPPSSCP